MKPPRPQRSRRQKPERIVRIKGGTEIICDNAVVLPSIEDDARKNWDYDSNHAFKQKLQHKQQQAKAHLQHLQERQIENQRIKQQTDEIMSTHRIPLNPHLQSKLSKLKKKLV
jgi:hypothetical protein